MEARIISKSITLQQRITFWLACLSFGLFCFVMLVSRFREQLLGIRPGYAPYNFGLNFEVLMPLALLACLLGLIASIRNLLHWRQWPHPGRKWWMLLLSMPSIVLGGYTIAWLVLISL